MIQEIPTSRYLAIVDLINDAAQAYKGVIPADVWKEPYFTLEELEEELEHGVKFFGWFEDDKLLGVMGLQRIMDITLLRHAYVLTIHQRKGIGKELLEHLVKLAQTPEVLVGTWAAAWWAIKFYEKNGFRLVQLENRSNLRKYWTIPDRQAEASVVLKLKRDNCSLPLESITNKTNGHLSMKKTIVLKVDPEKPEKEKIKIASTIIKTGGLVAFPTETVYGLGANALSSKAILALFAAKKRPLDNPPIVHVQKTSEVYKLTNEVPLKAKILMKQFWPGPLTLIFKRAPAIPHVTTAGLDTIAIRMPKNKIALELIKKSNCPIAAPSANLAGKPSPTTAKHVLDDLNGQIDAILDGGPTEIGVESSVLDISVDPPMLLRPGGISLETLRSAIKEIKLHPFITAETEIQSEKARSPGMKHKHYAPKTELILVDGTVPAVMSKIKALIGECWAENKRVGVLATDETAWAYEADVIKSLGSRRNIDAMAPNLFRILREFDEENIDIIFAESVSTEGLGLAVMNRLRKASGYKIIKT